MKIIKIPMLLRSTELIWTYKKTNGHDFWEDLLAKLGSTFGEPHIVRKKNGNFQHIFYILTEKDASDIETIIKGIISEMLADNPERQSIVVSCLNPDSKELASLKDTVPDIAEKKEFLAEANRQIEEPPSQKTVVPQAPSAEIPVKAPPSPKSEAQAQQKTVAEAPAKATAEPSEEEKPQPLSYHAERLRNLKNTLLDKVKGQRHAVDEVVQGIFECEMFSSINPNRKGPLATFLFTGPSGVGKTLLASQCEKVLDRPLLVVDMSEYSDNLANGKFNGNHGEAAVVTGFVRKNPNGIILFDEVEKAHINTIHLFLQILDEARLMDHQLKKEVSFKNNIIIMTTNAGKALYEDATVSDLSGTPKNVILEALRTDTNPQTGDPYFPQCITTRMASGHVILFNHLEPFALMEIIRDELNLQIGLFEKTSGIKVEYDPKLLAALVLYNGGGVADARTLRGVARNIIVSELQEIVMQLYARHADGLNSIQTISLCVDTNYGDDVDGLFVNRNKMYVSVFTEGHDDVFKLESEQRNTLFDVMCDADQFKRRIRGVNDYVLIDPLCGAADSKRIPNDIEDIDSEGMRMFRYVREFYPETPIYILDTAPHENHSFDTLLAKGARDVVKLSPKDPEAFNQALERLTLNALINNAVYSLGRSGKFLSFNCAQYIDDTSCAVVSFEKLQIKSAHLAGDDTSIATKGGNNDLKFDDIIGCKAAKETLKEFCAALDNPRQILLSGKRMPKGVLFYGPPGTGKTMLAKAMANECNATFFPISATTFFGSLVGETERNIRDIFKKARKYAPSIIFVDEVDAIGRKRTGTGSTHNEDALNAFLTEMDGFVTDEKRPVFILAATNYDLDGDSGRVLDPAFVRRFDSKILIPLPDTDDRYEFLSKYLKKHGIHFGEDHEQILRNMAKRTGGMSNADLEMMNAKYVRALGDGEPDRTKYLDTLDEFRFGEVNKMDPNHLRQTACHEAGHALVCRLGGSTPSFLTVVSRGGYGGFMETAGETEHGTYTFDELMNRVRQCLAGRIAEIELYGDSKGINTGASSDISKARYFIRACLDDFAMGEKMFARWTAKEAEDLIQLQYRTTQEMLHDHRDTLERLTDLLAEKKSLDQGQLQEFFAAENL